ncbi:MAG: hypothetical protein KBA61_00055 [Spirochaetes bacterium]|nr:hypothetical protein [Spirochaetota bacterium]
MKKELVQLRNYITSPESENASNHHVYPFFQRVFREDKFKKESEAAGADIYIEGRLVVELKTSENDWLSGFFQALHYSRKGLSFSAISVITKNFIGLWHVDNLPAEVNTILTNSDSNKSANEMGRINANKCSKALEKQILTRANFLYESEVNLFNPDLDVQLLEFEDRLKNLDVIRNQINPGNFLRKIGLLKQFFTNPLDAIHCFYTILPFWDVTSKVPDALPSKPTHLLLTTKSGSAISESFIMEPKHHKDFRSFVESHYVFTNDEGGISIDYYFSRFDEALAEHDPDYVKQHGIFFTDINLSRFALWFIREKFGEKKLSDKYIVIDPAGGSGNLVSSWRRNHLKFKIVSELNPDLLRTIELRLKHDPVQIEQGYSIIPRTHENKGLNFIDKPAGDYYSILERYLKEEGKSIDKPFAFLLNPPYKNTDENETVRDQTEANYGIDPSIVQLTGNDAGNERYLAFLAQILEISKLQKEKLPDIEPALMIFTPTSWLIPRPSYKSFREKFDAYFKFEKGFMITGQEFFKGTGRWPVAFTIWRYNQRKNNNKVILLDLTDLPGSAFLTVNWNESLEKINTEVKRIIRGKNEVLFDESREQIKETLPLLINTKNNEAEKQQMYDFKRSPTDTELKSRSIFGGLPLKDVRRANKKTYGSHNGNFIGFMDNGTPVRVNQDKYNRMSLKPDRIWFRLDNEIKSVNKSKLFNGPTDNRSYCAYDLESAKSLISWFSITKAINGVYPVWANQFDIWAPSIPTKYERDYYALCFAFVLAENRCIVTKFEKDNPVEGAPEIFVDNPLCPINSDSFWSKTLDPEVAEPLATKLVDSIKSLYTYWNVNYCRGQQVDYAGLQDEPYFKYFDYPDFVTPYSGLIQIKKYAELQGKTDISQVFDTIRELTKQVKESIYNMLVQDFKYFE